MHINGKYVSREAKLRLFFFLRRVKSPSSAAWRVEMTSNICTPAAAPVVRKDPTQAARQTTPCPKKNFGAMFNKNRLCSKTCHLRLVPKTGRRCVN